MRTRTSILSGPAIPNQRFHKALLNEEWSRAAWLLQNTRDRQHEVEQERAEIRRIVRRYNRRWRRMTGQNFHNA